MWLGEVRGYGTLTGRAWQQEGEVAGTAPAVGSGQAAPALPFHSAQAPGLGMVSLPS